MKFPKRSRTQSGTFPNKVRDPTVGVKEHSLTFRRRSELKAPEFPFEPHTSCKAEFDCDPDFSWGPREFSEHSS